MNDAITHLNDEAGTFSERFPVLFDPAGRLAKAEKIIAVLRDHFREGVGDLIVVDIGCSTGIMTRRFAEVFGQAVGLDTDPVGVLHGRRLARQSGSDPTRLRFLAADGCRMPLADYSADVVVCNQIYEHVDDQSDLMREIHRVLRPSGVCYFGAGTRHVLIEGHYKLPFLSWLPRGLAHLYMRLAGKKARYDVRLLSYRGLKKLAGDFHVIDYTLEIAGNPERYADADRSLVRRWVQRWPSWLLRLLVPLIPIHVWLLVKPSPDVAMGPGEFTQRLPRARGADHE